MAARHGTMGGECEFPLIPGCAILEGEETRRTLFVVKTRNVAKPLFPATDFFYMQIIRFQAKAGTWYQNGCIAGVPQAIPCNVQ